MEVNEMCSNFSNVFSLNGDIRSIENGMQSMRLITEADMLDCSDVSGASGNHSPWVPSEFQVLHNSTEAFLQFQREREDTTFSRTCLFCKKHFTGNRSLLLEHFTEQHNFFIGQPDNIVFINEFLDVLEKMLNKLQCLYCKKIFKDWSTLKEHMRKKMHKRINAADNNFDKFYMTNYLNAYNQVDLSIPVDYYERLEQHSNQDDEREIHVEPKDNSIVCLYCDKKCLNFDEIMYHLKVIHGFDFRYLRKEYRLCFYSQIKLINYIRRKVQVNECTVCDARCSSKITLVMHMTESSHIRLLPDRAKWDQPEFYFSTLDTDYLLCGLYDDDDDSDSDIEIISEDIVLPQSSILTDENLRRTLL